MTQELVTHAGCGCGVGAEPAEVLAAVRRTMPRRLELCPGSSDSFAVNLTSTHGTGIELSLVVRVLRAPGGSMVSVAAPGQPDGSLARRAAEEWLDVLLIELEAAERDAERRRAQPGSTGPS